MANNPDFSTVHATLQECFEAMAALYGKCDGLSTDTVFAIGEATGIIAKAKALVGRDIDDK